ncbi:hypothetical protein CSUB01_11835 [Colletotrichum sublineola]|uniref:Uncharacterized protein n=1 Tax=Colletotrichum sublineola TaxID=1173701 RepID=A0A066XT83_COLSU|nr:hypothetical protein CSUB01_11835 [Colletotrichum sublineola]
MSGLPDLVIPQVVAVREDQNRSPEIIPLQFQLRVRHSQQGLVLFRLVLSYTDGASTPERTIFLQVTADSVLSLDRTEHTKTNANQTPPCLEKVYKRLKDMRSIARLQFQLRSGEGIQLVVPLDFNVDNILGDAVRSTFEWAEWLAAASSFSLYFQHNVLPRKNYLMYQKVISLCPTENLRRSYKDMRDVKRLYEGNGGKVHKPRFRHDSSPTRKRCSSPDPATTASCGSTLPFDAVPRREHESPPPYNEYLNEGLSPRATPDAAATAIFAEGSTVGVAPPEYGDAEQQHTDVLDLSQGVLPCGVDDADKHPSTKRKRSFIDVHTTRTSARDVSRTGKTAQYRSVDLDQSYVAHLLEFQRQQFGLLQEQIKLRDQQIEKLENLVEKVQGRVQDLEKRHDELEGDCSTLEKRQEQTDDAIENVHVLVHELEDKCEELEKSISDACDDINDLKEDMREMLAGDKCKPCEDMAKNIGDRDEGSAPKYVTRAYKQAPVLTDPGWVCHIPTGPNGGGRLTYQSPRLVNLPRYPCIASMKRLQTKLSTIEGHQLLKQLPSLPEEIADAKSKDGGVASGSSALFARAINSSAAAGTQEGIRCPKALLAAAHDAERSHHLVSRPPAADSGPIDLAMETNWMRRTGWAEIFDGARRDNLVAMAELPVTAASSGGFPLGRDGEGNVLSSPPPTHRLGGRRSHGPLQGHATPHGCVYALLAPELGATPP